MNLGSIGRILWARRIVILTATASALLGAVVGDRMSPKQYEATSKINLQFVKPDPVTGFVVNSKNVDAYVESQIRMIRDYQVAIKVAEALGWLDSPEMQEAYANQPNNDGLDFDHWVALRVSGGTSAAMVAESNILAIKYRGSSPEFARAMADAIRTAYIDVSLDGQRQASAGTAAYQANQAALAKVKLAALENEKGVLERESGIVIGDNGTDLDSRRLHSMAVTTHSRPVRFRVGGQSSAAVNLATLETSLATAANSLGPNNPALKQLRQRRDLLAAQVAAERGAANGANDAKSGTDKFYAGRLNEQIATVLSQRERLARVRLVQDEIEVQQVKYAKASEQAVQSQQLASVRGGEFTPVGLTESSGELTARRRPLILFGSTGLGLAVGTLIALLMELLRRRVRSEADLMFIVPGVLHMELPIVKDVPTRRAGRTAGIGARLSSLRKLRRSPAPAPTQ